MENVKIKDYILSAKLNIGTRTTIYSDITNQYAIKLTHMDDNEHLHHDISYEAKIMRALESHKGFLKLIDFGVYEHFTYIITKRQGPSLKYLLGLCKGLFSLKTSLMLFDQIVL